MLYISAYNTWPIMVIIYFISHTYNYVQRLKYFPMIKQDKWHEHFQHKKEEESFCISIYIVVEIPSSYISYKLISLSLCSKWINYKCFWLHSQFRNRRGRCFWLHSQFRDCHGCDLIIVGFTTTCTCATSAYHN